MKKLFLYSLISLASLSVWPQKTAANLQENSIDRIGINLSIETGSLNYGSTGFLYGLGRKAVGDIGNGAGNKLVFKGINAEKDGNYEATIFYISGEDRTASVGCNGKTKTVQFPSTGSWALVKSVKTKLKLKKGENEIEIWNSSSYAPDIDCIVIGSN